MTSFTDGTFPSTCWECSTRCGSRITVAGGAVARIDPNPGHPGSLGAFCVKGIRGLPELTGHPDRLLHPMRRAGPRGSGRWQRIGWDEALDEVADRLLEVRDLHGPKSIVGAVSSALFSRGTSLVLMLRSLGSPNWMMNQDLCGGCRAVSDRITGLNMIGGEDIDAARCALVVGRNPSAADPVQWMALKRAKKRGAKIVVIDPARTPAADIADLWLRPRLGSDAALALAMIDVIVRDGTYDRDFVARWCHGFDELCARAAAFPPERAAGLTGVPAVDIVAAARLYADGPSTFVSGHGIDAASAGVQTFRAFHALVAITGNLDRAGGNRRAKRPPGFKSYLDVLHDPAFRLPREAEEATIGADRFPLWAGPRGWQSACHNPSVIDAMLTGQPYPVRALYVTGVNIAVTYPDTPKTLRAMRSLDLIVAVSHMMTPTTEIADIVLPKTTAVEEEEISLDPSGPCVSFTRAAVAPRGEARSDFDIAVALMDRFRARGALAHDFVPWRTKREFNTYLMGPIAEKFDELAAVGWLKFPFATGDFETAGFKTSTGKLELYSETLKGLGLDPLPNYVPPRAEREGDAVRAAYPLVLLSGAREKTYHHSRFREQAWARKVSPYPELQIHPDTALACGLADGDWVSVECANGPAPCTLRLEVTDVTPPGVVRTGMGWWLPEAPGPERAALEINVNAAMSYDGPWDPVTGSADTRGLPCRIARCAAPAAFAAAGVAAE
ncbi:MAG: molybdopterin-dependent oxidoreductase [Rhodospirillales bacterium]